MVLEKGLLVALALAGCPMDDTVKTAFLAARQNKTNTSQRLPVGDYYNQETVELVASCERILVELHGYEPPTFVEPTS